MIRKSLSQNKSQEVAREKAKQITGYGVPKKFGAKKPEKPTDLPEEVEQWLSTIEKLEPS